LMIATAVIIKYCQLRWCENPLVHLIFEVAMINMP
jgi:hypothetical protein